MLPEGISARSRRRLTAVRAARLIDALIDQAHRDWPDAGFVIRLPSGEDVFLPAHRSGGTPCPLGHAGYFRDRVRPFCEVDPTLHHAGICRIARYRSMRMSIIQMLQAPSLQRRAHPPRSVIRGASPRLTYRASDTQGFQGVAGDWERVG